jgi:hypothetical protein
MYAYNVYMSLYDYTCMYIHYVYMYLYIYIYIRIYIYIHTYICNRFDLSCARESMVHALSDDGSFFHRSPATQERNDLIYTGKSMYVCTHLYKYVYIYINTYIYNEYTCIII